MNKPRKRQIGILSLLLAGPLCLGALWGVQLSDRAFEYFNAARHIANSDLLALTPLYGQGLLFGANLGLSLPVLGLAVGIIGWWVTAVAIYTIFQRISNFRHISFLTSMLVAITPVFLPTLGTEVPWIIALAWLSIAFSLKQNWFGQLITLLFLFLVHFAVSTVALMLLLLGAGWFVGRRFPWRLGLALLVTVAGLWWVGTPSSWQPLYPSGMDLSTVWAAVKQIGAYDEINWLFVPPVSLGLWALYQQKRQLVAGWAGLIWVGLMFVFDGELGLLATVVAGLLLSGVGIDWLVVCLKTGQRWQKDFLTFILFLPLLVAQLVLVERRFAERPLPRFQLEQQAGIWLLENSDPEATVAGSVRVAYWADRIWMSLADGNDFVDPLTTNDETLPDYVILGRNIEAGQWMRTGWFQERYKMLHQVASSFDSSSPYTIWGYRPVIYDLGAAQPLNVRASDAIEIVGYEVTPQRILAGQSVQLTLFLQALKLVTDPMQLTVRLAAADGQVVVQSAVMLIPPSEPGQVVVESFSIGTSVELAVGAYEINFSLGLPGESVWPLYRNNDTNQLDRAWLGNVVVPWQGEIDGATLLEAVFGDQIKLTAFTIEGDFKPGGFVDVTLYWQALRSPDLDYVVFVHVLDAAGNLVVGHDGGPVDGRFPTTAWLIDEVVEDTHTLSLETKPDPGQLLIQVGLYVPATGERLPVWNSLGVEQPARVMPLTTLEIR